MTLLSRTFTSAALAALLVMSASANSITNGNFNAGFTGWTVANTPNGAGAPGSVDPWDIDGPGPLPPSPAAHFRAGQAAAAEGQGGIFLGQVVNLSAGQQYLVGFDWSSACLNSNPDGGRFELVVGDHVLAFAEAGFLAAGQPRYGHVQANFTPTTSGNFVVGARVTRRGVEPDPAVNEYIDNFVALARIPLPAEAFHVTMGSLFSGNLTSLQQADNNEVCAFNDPRTLTAIIDFATHSPVRPSQIGFTLVGNVSRRGLVEEVQLFNFTLSDWITFDSNDATLHPSPSESFVLENPGQYVGENGLLRSRVLFYPFNDETPSQDGWLNCVDLARWSVVD